MNTPGVEESVARSSWMGLPEAAACLAFHGLAAAFIRMFLPTNRGHDDEFGNQEVRDGQR